LGNLLYSSEYGFDAFFQCQVLEKKGKNSYSVSPEYQFDFE
jgi:hypothetical protein